MDAGGGWLIFALPPAELAVHPAIEGGRAELYFMTNPWLAVSISGALLHPAFVLRTSELARQFTLDWSSCRGPSQRRSARVTTGMTTKVIRVNSLTARRGDVVANGCDR